MFEPCDETPFTGIAQMNDGVDMDLLGDCDTALSHCKRARSHVEEAGDVRAALSLANRAVGSFSILDDCLHLADIYLLKGKIHRVMRRFELAEWYIQTSLKLNRSIEDQLSVGEC